MTSNRKGAVRSRRRTTPTTENPIEEVPGHAAGPHAGDRIEVGYQVFTSDGGDELGAVRDVFSDGLVVYVENAGDFRVPLAAVEAVHFQKVILTCAKLSRSLRRAIGHAHDAEVPGA